MALKYSLVFLGLLAVLGLLKCVEGSPIRSWKTVFFTTIPLGFIICYYLSCAISKPLPPAPQTKKIAAYRAELERTIRRIEGVDHASINDTKIEMNFSSDKPVDKLKEIALHVGATAAYFMKPKGTNLAITVHMTIVGRDRYEMIYDTAKGMTHDEVFQ